MKPSVIVIARSSFDVGAVNDWLRQNNTSWKRADDSTPAEELVEVAGRICYMSFGESQSKRSTSEYIQNLILQGHESVLEHVNWTFLLAGVSRAFTHQLVRHRPGFAYSQLSQQYHDEHDATFVMPSNLEHTPKALQAWQKAVQTSKTAYAEILSALSDQEKSDGLTTPKEIRRAMHSAARSVLPNATETKIVVTANARALRHFLTVRGATLGDYEMRQVSAELLSILSKEAPSIFSDFKLTEHDDGLPIIVRVSPQNQT